MSTVLPVRGRNDFNIFFVFQICWITMCWRLHMWIIMSFATRWYHFCLSTTDNTYIILLPSIIWLKKHCADISPKTNLSVSFKQPMPVLVCSLDNIAASLALHRASYRWFSASYGSRSSELCRHFLLEMPFNCFRSSSARIRRFPFAICTILQCEPIYHRIRTCMSCCTTPSTGTRATSKNNGLTANEYHE